MTLLRLFLHNLLRRIQELRGRSWLLPLAAVDRLKALK